LKTTFKNSKIKKDGMFLMIFNTKEVSNVL
jgi:hypothetical protein